MFFVASKIFEAVFAPVNFFLFLAAIGAALLYTRFWRWGRRLATAGAAALTIMVFSPIGGFLAAPLEARFPPPPEDMPAPDGIIVLGGSLDERLSSAIGRPVLADAAERLTAPVALKRRFPHARLVFTGGSAALRGSTSSEAAAAGRFWRDMGIDDGDALYEGRSRNTYENAVFSRELAQPKAGERWLLVTSATHMPRSVGIFRKAGWPVIAYPVDYHTNGKIFPPLQSGDRLRLVGAAAHEWVGLVVYWLTGKTDALFPAP
jgi:uncharacterized SAM-binding protein YcdF (DUF218 family)